MTKYFFPSLLVAIFSLSLVISYRVAYNKDFLSFSDGAKFADIARNLVGGNGYTSNFSNFASGEIGRSGISPISHWVPVLMPVAIAGFFKIFGISDLSVIATSSFFFLLLVLVTYLLGKRLWGNLIGLLASIAVASNQNFLDYAASGASEPLFAFEIVLAAYLFILKNRLANIAGFLVLVLMYFTRAQAIIYIFGFLLLFLLLNFPKKRAVGYFALAFALGSLTFFATSKQGMFAITQNLPGIASSASLRGGLQQAGILALFKKVFYNLYNFFTLIPQIMSPYLWVLFIIGLFKWNEHRNKVLKGDVENSLKISIIFMVVATFVVTALTIPLFRYLHPIVPLVYLLGTATLVWIVERGYDNKHGVAAVSGLLIFIFVVGQTLGLIFLDSRFKAKTVNKDKPPVYVVLSRILKDNTDLGDTVVTNLDTWGSWYGERKTVWFPLKPEQLNVKETSFDEIFLTSYLVDDENYYMGSGWRQIFENPKSPQDKFIAENYQFVGEFKVSSEETYEGQPARAVLLIRK